MNNEIKNWNYTLRDASGGWLGQIVLTSDGAFMSITDWGNLSNAWRSTGSQHKDFRHFIASLNVEYFGSKLYQGMTYILYSGKCEKACMTFAEKILPPLQEAIRKELEAEKSQAL